MRRHIKWSYRGRARGIRGRTTLFATLVVAVALVAASSGLLVLQRQQLIDGLAAVARQQGQNAVAQIQESGIDAVDVSALSATAGEPALMQIINGQGTVLISSEQLSGRGAIAEVDPGVQATDVRTVEKLPHDDGDSDEEDDEPFVIVTTAQQTPQGTVRVVTAQSLESVQRATTTLLTLLVFGVPLVLMVVAFTSYRVVGRALAPVEGIRSKVAQISAADQDTRVPVPDSGDEIARLAETMNSMLGRLQAAAAAQHAFVADASHELRSPLATIRATTELAQSHPEAMDAATSNETVLTETARLERLVSDLLLLAKSDEHGLVMRVDDVDLDDIVTSEAARLRQGLVTDVVVHVRAVRVKGDAQNLMRAVRNLTDNAARYAASRVEIRLDHDGGRACLDVIDDGPGIPAADEDRVFERFVRLDASRERGTGGTGLGLAITQQIVRAHGGDIAVVASSDSQGKGAHLRLTLPLVAHE